MFAVTIILCGIVLLLQYYLRRANNYWKARNVKGPEPGILFGNFKDCSLHREEVPVAMKKIYDEYRTEKVVGVYRMTKPALMLRNLDIIKHVMIKDFEIFEDRGLCLSRRGLGANLFTADVETWRVLRHQFTPLFTSGKLRNMLHLITERGDKFLDHVEAAARQRPEQEVHVLIQLFTVSTIAACAFGLDIDISNTDQPFLEELRKIDHLVFTKSIIKEIIYLYPYIFSKIDITVFSNELSVFFRNLVNKVLEERKGAKTSRNDFMDLILELRNRGDASGPRRATGLGNLHLEITEDVMAAQAFVFYAAGYETSATTMTFMLYELAKNPSIQEKLHAEINDVLERTNGKVTYDALWELPYMEKVFDETLRKYPIQDPLQRQAKCDYKVPGTDLTIEKGTMVLVPVTAIHHDETIYPNPQMFDPERFSAKSVAERHPCAYLPFGIGPRNCIGMRFAKLQSRMCMLKLLSRFRVELAGREMVLDVSRALVGPQKGYRLRFLPREKVTRKWRFRSSIVNQLSMECRKQVTELLEPEPQLRPTARAVLTGPWIAMDTRLTKFSFLEETLLKEAEEEMKRRSSTMDDILESERLAELRRKSRAKESLKVLKQANTQSKSKQVISKE